MSYWGVAQVVSKMEHIVRREIEKNDRGAFLPTYARHWKVDGRQYSVERATIGGYVFFHTEGDDYAGIPDIHGVYGVLRNPNGTAARVKDREMIRMVMNHAFAQHETLPPRYTKYYQAPAKASSRRKSRKPRASRRLHGFNTP